MGVIADTILKQSFCFHTEVLVIPDDNVVENINPNNLSGFYQPFCQADVLLRGANITWGMIVHKDAEDSIIQTHFLS